MYVTDREREGEGEREKETEGEREDSATNNLKLKATRLLSLCNLCASTMKPIDGKRRNKAFSRRHGGETKAGPAGAAAD